MSGNSTIKPVTIFDPLTVDGFNVDQDQFEEQVFQDPAFRNRWPSSLKDSGVRVDDQLGKAGEGIVDPGDMFVDMVLLGLYPAPEPVLDDNQTRALLNRTCARFAEKSPLTQTADAKAALKGAGASQWTGRYNAERMGCEYLPGRPRRNQKVDNKR